VCRWLLAVVVFAGCHRDAEETPSAVLATARRALAERERRLTSFHLAIHSTEAGATATHEVFFRAPNHLRGELLTPRRLTTAFDGRRLFQVDHQQKTFRAFDLELTPLKAAYFLAETFQPFVPEGFRSPLLPTHGVVATKVTHPKATQAVSLRVDAGEGVVVTWVLRLPAGDLLEKRTSNGAAHELLRVDDELCDSALKLCVPKTLTQLEGDSVIGLTTATSIELNPALSTDTFSLSAPAGFSSSVQTLGETGRQNSVAPGP
jgi:outer membrane lipoprotein-sorting protein